MNKKNIKSDNTSPCENAGMCNLGNATVCLGNAQHQGKRDYQEDSFGFSDTSSDITLKKGILAVVADGMGGLTNGKQVSSQVVSSLLEWFNSENSICNNSLDIKNAVTHINADICRTFCVNGRVTSGSTIVTAFIKNGTLSWLCVGDSRIYLKRGGRLYQLNEDHDLLNNLLDLYISGEYGLGEAFSDPQREGLVSCIGKARIDFYDLNKKTFPLCDNDIIILCSDGVYNSLTSEEFNELITPDAMKTASDIRDTVLTKNFINQDNLTVLAMTYKKS